jgi:hypothetical protein
VRETHTPKERDSHTHTERERQRQTRFPGASSSLRHPLRQRSIVPDNEILVPNGSTVTRMIMTGRNVPGSFRPTRRGTPGKQSATSPGRVGGGLVRGGVALVSWEKEGWRGQGRLPAGMTPRIPHSRPFLYTFVSISTSSLPCTERSSCQDRIRRTRNKNETYDVL